jgi:tyrosyl-tRNA synthetase
MTSQGLSPDDQLAKLSRGTVEILPDPGALLERLRQCARTGRPLRVKQGFDPTAPDIHLGHTVGLRKLRQFQDLGHQVVLIVGDYTGMVGDPSGRSKTRPQLTPQEVEAHARTYLEQFFQVLDPRPEPPRLPVEVHRNGEWFAGMQFMDVMRLAAQYTVARVLERDDFAKRMREQQPISLHELFYPIMQGYDSVAIRADVELGATEQKFNLLVGRVLQEAHGQAPQIALTLPVLPGLDGVQRMSKSLGNYVGVTDEPREMFGKIMSLPDRLMGAYWELVTDATEDELAAVERQRALATGASGVTPAELEQAGGSLHPMTLKKNLAHRIVRMYHGGEAADRAQRAFEEQFQSRGVPDDLPEWSPEPSVREMGIKDLLVKAGLARSGSEAWRKVDEGAVAIDQVRIKDRVHRQSLVSPFVLQLGRRMVRVVPRP